MIINKDRDSLRVREDGLLEMKVCVRVGIAYLASGYLIWKAPLGTPESSLAFANARPVDIMERSRARMGDDMTIEIRKGGLGNAERNSEPVTEA